MKPSEITVLYVLGLPHCGSTIFSLAMQDGAQCVAVGEASTLSSYYRGGPNTRDASDARCSCGAPFIDCAFWQSIDNRVRALGTALEDLDLTRDNATSFARDNELFFLGVAQATNARVIIDSSKGWFRLARLLDETELRIVVVHLTRSLKHFLASNKKRYDIGCREIVRLTRTYVDHMRISRRFSRRTPYCHVYFERFLNHPEIYVRRVNRTLGLNLQSCVTEEPFRPHHQLGGNRVRFAPQPLSLSRATGTCGAFAFRQRFLIELVNLLSHVVRPSKPVGM